MLSILITIYNYNLLPLVKELHQQCLDLNIDFEILTQDDASNSVYNVENEKINHLSNCQFISLKKNVGYRENKNILVSSSKFENLLILDGDCLLPYPNFIKNYLNEIEDYEVVYGGRIHAEKAPSKNQLLRWKYGKHMEDQTVDQRNKNVYRATLFNNTFIKKTVNDDTLFSFELLKMNSKIKHIHNPVQHDDIDTNAVYIEKTKNSLDNLYLLYKKELITKEYSKMVNLVTKLHAYKITYLLAILYSAFGNLLENQLKGNQSSLFVFNVFRLTYFSKIYIG